MYSIKEKNKYLRDLAAVEHAEKDLDLLRKLDPRNDQLPSFSLSPRRNAEKILYALLDIATAEEIRNNRRAEKRIRAEKKTKVAKNKKLSDLKETVENLENRNSELETKLEEKKSNIETSHAVSHPATKPKSAAPSSKKKPSILTSTGKSSKTKTSK